MPMLVLGTLRGLTLLLLLMGTTAHSTAAAMQKTQRNEKAEGVASKATFTLNREVNDDGAALNIHISPSPHHQAVDSFRCEYFDGYPSVCGNLSQCNYCCATAQCLETAESAGAAADPVVPLAGYHVYPGNFTCPNAAVLPAGAVNCDVTCDVYTEQNKLQKGQSTDSTSDLCAQCLDRPWCLHCANPHHPEETCLPRHSAVCPKTMVDSCVATAVPTTETFVDQVIPWVVLFCIIAGLLVVIIPLLKWFTMWVKGKLGERRDARRRQEFREQQQRREQADQDRREGRSVTGDGINSTSSHVPSSLSPTQGGGGDSSTDGFSTTATVGAASGGGAPHSSGNIPSSSTELVADHQPLLSSSNAEVGSSRSGAAGAASTTALASKIDAAVVAVESPTSSKASFSDEDACQLCLDARATIVYYPCYHSYCCEDCSAKIRPSGNRRDGHRIVCPFCRQGVRAMVNTEPLPDTIKQSLRRRQ